jgi:hypothetical protein
MKTIQTLPLKCYLDFSGSTRKIAIPYINNLYLLLNYSIIKSCGAIMLTPAIPDSNNPDFNIDSNNPDSNNPDLIPTIKISKCKQTTKLMLRKIASRKQKNWEL